MSNWQATNYCLPADGKLVETKIDDERGVRNVAILKRERNLWWLSDGSMYIYYVPTHWGYI